MALYLITAADSGGDQITAGETVHQSISGDMLRDTQEGDTQFRARNAWTASDLYLRVRNNNITAASTFRFRNNGGNGNQTVTVPASTSGVFKDTTNTDSIVSADLINSQIVAGATGTTLFLLVASYTFEDPTGTVYPLNLGGPAQTQGRDSTFYWPINGSLTGTSTRTNVQYRVRTTTTFSNLRVNILSNGNSEASTWTFQVAGSPGNQTLTIPASTAGAFEDTTNVDTVTANNLVDLEFATGKGSHSDAGAQMEPIGLHGDAAARVTVGGGAQQTLPDGNIEWSCLEITGRATATAEDRAQVEARNGYDISNMFFRIPTNSLNAAAPFALRVNGASSALSVSVGAAATGTFENTTDTVTVAPTDEINTQFDGSAASSGTQTRRTVSYQIQEAAETAAVSGTATESADESDVVDGGLLIVITLNGTTWDADIGADNAQTQDLIDGIDSNLGEGTGWDAVVKAGLDFGDVARTSDTIVTITLPAFASYNITATETITVIVPASALSTADPLTASPTFDIAVLIPSAALAGTITDDNELDIRNGGSTIILTLTNDTWVATGATFDAQRQNIIDGLDSGGAEPGGWDAVVLAALDVGDVARTSDTEVTITIPVAGIPGYNITGTETITATVPASALVISADPLIADPTFDITFLTETAAVSGSVTASANENDVRAGALEIVLTLTNVQWEADVGADNAQTQALIDGIDSNLAEGTGWDAVVRDGLTFGDVARTSDTVVTITLPVFASYNITATETITVIVPASALDFPDPITASPTFDIAVLGGAYGGAVGIQQRELLLIEV